MFQRLKDPFVGLNELEAEWVATKSWIYRIQIHIPSMGPRSKAVLAFDGLDTFAEVRLGGSTILRSDNMFISHRVDVSEILKSQDQHVLEVEFDSALLRAREIMRADPDHKWMCWNGESARLAVRKAQYHWGWDWGPLLMCAGIWKPIRLEVYTVRIEELKTDVVVTSDRKQATVGVSARIETNHTDDGDDDDDLEAIFRLSLEGQIISETRQPISPQGYACVKFTIDSPSLWMPAGYGSQKLYDVQVILLSQKVEVHSESCRIGLREVVLVQQPDRHGKSFYFRINGVDIFCGGSCWIPTDSFLTNVTPERYRAWIELVVAANQKMIRYVPLPSL